MNINWVVANHTLIDPTVDLDQLKEIGSIWGSWQTWRSCQTDNVICHDVAKAQQLIENKFSTLCNFYVPKSLYDTLDNPIGIQVYGGNFDHEIDNHDEIIAMHLAATASDIVLLLGFDWHTKLSDQKHINYQNLIRYAIDQNKQTQWVLLDHQAPTWPELSKLDNLTQDTLPNVIKMLTR